MTGSRLQDPEPSLVVCESGENWRRRLLVAPISEVRGGLRGGVLHPGEGVAKSPTGSMRCLRILHASVWPIGARAPMSPRSRQESTDTPRNSSSGAQSKSARGGSRPAMGEDIFPEVFLREDPEGLGISRAPAGDVHLAKVLERRTRGPMQSLLLAVLRAGSSSACRGLRPHPMHVTCSTRKTVHVHRLMPDLARGAHLRRRRRPVDAPPSVTRISCASSG